MNATAAQPDIAVFVDSLPLGGAEMVTLALVQGFVRRGLHVDLVIGAPDGPLVADVPAGAGLVSLAGKRTPRGLDFRHETLRMLASTVPLARYLRRARPRVLLAAKAHANVTAVAAARLARYAGPVLITEHTYLTGELPSAEAARRAPKNRVVRRVYPLADHIVTVSRGAADDMSAVTGIPRDRIEVVYNPVILPDLQEKGNAPLDHPWFAAGEPPVILGSGRFTTQKDFGTLVRAFDQLSRSTPARLMILGDGPEKPAVEQLVRELGLQDRVALPGFMRNPHPYVKRSAVFAYSSVWESFGLVLIEALALGTPVVSTDCGAPRELLQGGQLGRLTPVGDAPALAEALRATLHEGRARVPQEALRPFTLDAAVSSYLRLMGLPDGGAPRSSETDQPAAREEPVSQP